MTTPDDERRRAEDAAWRDIVAHYGEQPPAQELDDAAPRIQRRDPEPESETEPEPPREAWTPEDEEGFAPPPPPPVPRPTPRRAAAWAGVFGAPLVLLIVAGLGTGLPDLLGVVLAVWFVGGFGYLVATMGRTPRDPWDDGSRL